MADPTESTSSTGLIVGAGAVSAMVTAFVTGLFRRTVNSEDEVRKEMRTDIKDLLGKAASQKDDITKLTAEVNGLRERLVRAEDQAVAAHRRLDDGARAKP